MRVVSTGGINRKCGNGIRLLSATAATKSSTQQSFRFTLYPHFWNALSKIYQDHKRGKKQR